MNENAYDKLRGSIGTHWSGNNITTILGWVTIASYNVEALEMSISLCRETIRRNTVLGLVLSAGTGSLSVTNFGLISSKNLQTVFNILFTTLSFIITISAGRIKVYQYQERLEQFIKAKQEWTSFITTISTELQLPIHLRLDALYLINSNKDKYLYLLNLDYELPNSVKNYIKNKMQDRRMNNEHHMSLIRNNGLTVSDITFDIAVTEGDILNDAQQYPNYNHNIEINRIYDEICKHYTYKQLQTHYVSTNTTSKSMFGNLNSTFFSQKLQALRNMLVNF
jgi:hypothetical protein